MRKLSFGLILLLLVALAAGCTGRAGGATPSSSGSAVAQPGSSSETSENEEGTAGSAAPSSSSTSSGANAGNGAEGAPTNGGGSAGGPEGTATEQAEAALKRLTLRQKAAQVLLLDFAGVETGTAGLRELLAESPPGGLMIMGGNVKNPEQLKKMIAFFQDTVGEGGAPAQLLIAVDQEGGTVQRIREGVPAIPAARTLGTTATPAKAGEIADQTATELLSLGVNMNLAPVADVVEGKDSFLYSRSYGGNATRVAQYVTAVTRAFNRRGLVAVLKHFPGHGSASGNTHNSAVVATATRHEFETVHLVPFEAGIQAGAEAVLVSHIVADAYDAEHPATSSEKVVEGLLRHQLGFTGLVVTDALEMSAARTVNGQVGSDDPEDVAQTAVSALKAGCDLLISGGTFAAQMVILDTIVAAVKSGELPLTRLNDAALRVLELKARHGLLEAR